MKNALPDASPPAAPAEVCDFPGHRGRGFGSPRRAGGKSCWACNKRGFTRPAKLAVGDGALGFWSALSEVYPQTRKPALLDAQGPATSSTTSRKSGQPKAKQACTRFGWPMTRAAAERAFDHWIERYEDKYPKATRGAARLLRLPRGALDAPAHHERDGVGVRHHPSPELAGEGLRHPPHDTNPPYTRLDNSSTEIGRSHCAL